MVKKIVKPNKIDSELMRIDKRLAEAIRKNKKEAKEKINVEISIPQASTSLFEEFQKFKLNKKEEIKF